MFIRIKYNEELIRYFIWACIFLVEPYYECLYCLRVLAFYRY